MGRPLNIKRKDGLGYWPLWCLSEEEYYDLTDGGDCYIHKHDQMYFTETELLEGALDGRYYTETELLIDGVLDDRYYTETEIDAIVAALDHGDLNGLDDPADHTWALLVDGSRPLTGDWSDNAGNIILNNNKYFGIKRSSGELVNMVYFNPSNQVYLSHASYETTLQGSPIKFRTGVTTTLNATDLLIDALVPFTIGSTVEIDAILDQDDFYSDSDTALATQQSIKAYVDTEIAGIDLSAYLRHDGTIALSADWDIGNTRKIRAKFIQSCISPASGLKLSNYGDTGYVYIKDGSNYVGINTTDPGKPLTVFSPSNSIVGQLEHDGANAFLEFIDSSTTSNKVYLGAIGDDLVLFGDGTSALRITTSGLIDVANSACVLDEDSLGTDSATQLATQQSIKAYVDNKSYIDLGSILTSNGSYVGTKITVTVDDASTVFGNVLAQASDFNYDRADADAATTSVGLVLALSSGSGSKEVLVEGMACNTSWSWSAGLLYLSTTTGAMTQTAPSGTGDQVVAVGWALSATCIYFKPSLVLAEIA